MKHQQQRGMTLLGILFVFAIFGVFALAAVRLAPAFLEYQSVAKALDGLKSAGENTPAQITRSVEKGFDIGDVKSIDAKSLEISREDDQFVVRAEYDYKAPFIANVSFLVHFDKKVEIPAQ
jgi:Domain of unknown function (DUF4845)/Prokaryotic N-terminal methylation motif